MNDAAWLEAAERSLGERSLDEARYAFEQAERCGADRERVSAGRWLLLMLAGEYERAWSESDEIRRRDAPDPHRFWRGEPLDGVRVIVRCLHGYGDAVQMLRYAPLLQHCAGRVVYEVPPRLVELAWFFDGVVEVITWGEGSPAEPLDWDVQVEIMELPYLFRTTPSYLPIATEYLHLPPALISDTADKLGVFEGARVGVVWAAGDWNTSRSIPLEDFAPVLTVEGVEFWSLQGGASAIGRETLPTSEQLRDAGYACGDGLLALAATIANLNLVITVDTLAAHLAGAMGKTVWLLLQSSADWRWMVSRNDSPWYPSMRLFRQEAGEGWAGVVGRVMDALHQFRFEGQPAASLQEFSS